MYFDARVVHVSDGDSIVVEREAAGEGERVEIRLFGIDAPERGQPWGKRARSALSERVLGKEVRINAVATDRYGRLVGEVYADNTCVACELLRAGHVWVYRRYTEDRGLLSLEAEARAARRGLWSLGPAEQVPPWEWRRGARAPAPPAPAQPLPMVPSPSCGPKRTCREMASCAEAHHYLERCQLERLDGDRDGVPCETLCGGSR